MSAVGRVLSFAIAALLAACSDSGTAPAPAPAGPRPLTHITFVTDWKAQAEHGGYYQALAEGLYRKRGLDVHIVQGGPAVNVGQMLAGGAADFGIGSNGFVPLNLVREGAHIRAVMAVFQKDPQVLITHPRADIHGLADMRGKPILISDAAQATFWIWLKAKFGFEDSQIRKYTFNFAPFLTDPDAIQEGYISSEPYLIEREGHFKPQVYQLADYGYPGYANMVLVPQHWIDERPEVVQAFVEASIEGWAQYLFGNPSPGDAAIKRDNPDMTDDVLAQAREKLRELGHGDAARDRAARPGRDDRHTLGGVFCGDGEPRRLSQDHALAGRLYDAVREPELQRAVPALRSADRTARPDRAPNCAPGRAGSGAGAGAGSARSLSITSLCLADRIRPGHGCACRPSRRRKDLCQWRACAVARPLAGAGADRSRYRGGRVPLAARTFGLRQIDGAAHPRRVAGAERGHGELARRESRASDSSFRMPR